MRFPEDQERSKTLETSPPFLTFGSLTVPYFLSYSLIILMTVHLRTVFQALFLQKKYIKNSFLQKNKNKRIAIQN